MRHGSSTLEPYLNTHPDNTKRGRNKGGNPPVIRRPILFEGPQSSLDWNQDGRATNDAPLLAANVLNMMELVGKHISRPS
jgi:hypothetical protein